jgi:hypothetical protein
LPFTLFHSGARISGTLKAMDGMELRVWAPSPIDVGSDCGGSLSLGAGVTVGLDLHVVHRSEGGHDGVRGHFLTATYNLQRAADEIPLFDMLRFLGATIDPLARRSRPDTRPTSSGAAHRSAEATRNRHSQGGGDDSRDGRSVERSNVAASLQSVRSAAGQSLSGQEHGFSMPSQDVIGQTFEAGDDDDFQADLATEPPMAGHKTSTESRMPTPQPLPSFVPSLAPSRGFSVQSPGPGRLDVPSLDLLNTSLPPMPAAPQAAVSFATDTWDLPAISDGPLSQSSSGRRPMAAAASDFERVGLHLSRSLGRSLGHSQDSGAGLHAAPPPPSTVVQPPVTAQRLDVPRLDIPRLDIPRLDAPRLARRASDPGYRPERAARAVPSRPKQGFLQSHQEISLRRLQHSDPTATGGHRGNVGPHSAPSSAAHEHPSEASRGMSMHDSVADDHLNSSFTERDEPAPFIQMAKVPAAAPGLKRDELPTPLVAGGNPAFIKLSYLTRDLARAAIRPCGQQLWFFARAVDGLLTDQTLLVLLELPNNQYLQFDAKVHTVKPDLIVETTTRDLGLVRAVLAAMTPLG